MLKKRCADCEQDKLVERVSAQQEPQGRLPPLRQGLQQRTHS